MEERRRLIDTPFKIVLIGDSCTGKSSAIRQCTKSTFDKNYTITIGVEFETCYIVANKRKLKLYLWDTAGSPMFNFVTKNYYPESDGIIIFYDITKRKTFDGLDKWMDDIKARITHNTSILLVGCKTDLDHLREVSTEEGVEYAKKNEIDFIEISAKYKDDVDKMFRMIIEDICNYSESEDYPDTDKCHQWCSVS